MRKPTGATRRAVLASLAASGAMAASPSLAQPVTPYGGADLAVPGGRLRYEISGAGSRTVLMMHDAISDSRIWDDVWPIFTREFRAARYDRRGFGRSPAATAPYSARDDLAAVIARLGAPVAMIASSTSAHVALDYAIANPGHVQQLLLVSPIVAGVPPPDPLASRMAANNAPLAQGDVETAVSNWVNDRYIVAGPNRRARARLRAVLEASPQNLTHGDPASSPLTAMLGRVQTPVHILSGARDVPEIVTHSQSLERMIPGAQRAPVQGSGHLIYIDEPEIFAAAAIAFIRTWTSRDP